jgi:hypothetical protein
MPRSVGSGEMTYDPGMTDAVESNGVRSDDLVRWLDQHGAPTIQKVDGASLAALRAVPMRVSVSSTTLRISVYLWRDFQPRVSLRRDFQPASPPDGQPLIAVVRVRTVAEALLPEISAGRIAVIRRGQAWIAPMVEENPYSRGDSRLEVVARNGPRWGPGILVDVILELRDSSGKAHLIRVPDEEIERTE